MKYVLIYLLSVNAVAFLFMLADKSKARRGAWRISEATLMTLAAIGGCYGAFLGMRLFRHKTRHPKFFVGIPALMAVYTAALVWLYVTLLR